MPKKITVRKNTNNKTLFQQQQTSYFSLTCGRCVEQTLLEYLTRIKLQSE